MPIYEYDCRPCGKRFEMLARSAEDDNPSCPDCGASDCRRAFSVFAVGGSSRGGESEAAASGPDCSDCTRSSCPGRW